MLLNQKKEIQEVFEQILGIPLDFQPLPSEEEENIKQDFINLINTFEELWKRQNDFKELFKIDFDTYDDKFFRLIEKLIYFSFSIPVAEAILFYIYSRFDDEGNIIPFTDEDNKSHKFESPEDLWDYTLCYIEQNLNNDELLDL